MVNFMCDYSLEHFASRPAETGETLVLRKFPSGSPGFVGAKTDQDAIPTEAVCLAEGCLLRIELYDAELGLGIEDIFFTHTSPHMGHTGYRDALKMADGSVRRLTSLPQGTRVRVLMLVKADAKEDRELASPALSDSRLPIAV